MLKIHNILNYSTKDIKDMIITNEFLICAGREQLIYITNLTTNVSIKINPYAGNINSLAYDGKKVYFGCQNGNIKIYEPSGEYCGTLSGHSGNVCTLDVKNNTLISGSWDHTIKIWDISTEMMIESIELSATIWSVKFIDEIRFLAGCADKKVRIYKMAKLETVISLHNFCIRGVLFKNDFIFSIDNEGTLLKTNMSGDLVTHYSLKEFMYCISMFNDKIICCGENGRICIFSQDLEFIDQTKVPCVSCWKLYFYDNKLYVCGSDGSIYILKDSDSLAMPEKEFVNPNSAEAKEYVSNGIKFKVVDNNVFQFVDNEWIFIGVQKPEYDHSFTIELGGNNYTLSFNKKDNIYEVARNFLLVNKLNPEYTDEIVQYIKQNFPHVEYKIYERINIPGVKKELSKFTDIQYIYLNLEQPNKQHERFLESELTWIYEHDAKYVALDLYRYFLVNGLYFDMSFLFQFQAQEKKDAVALVRLLTVMYADPPFNLELLYPIVLQLKDIGYLKSSDLDDFYSNRQLRNRN